MTATLPTPPPPPQSAQADSRLWDVFCKVIDNHGDLGVLWRLSCQLARRGQTVRLWVDDARALEWMAPHGQPGVSVHPWADSTHLPTLQTLPPSDVWVEGFGCEISENFIAHYSNKISDKGIFLSKPYQWINLEYLTAESYAARCHGLPSPVMSGPGKGSVKRFHYPGFTPDTGGLLREPDLAHRHAAFKRAAWLQAQGIPWQGERLVSLFCYESPALSEFMRALAMAPTPNLMLVTHGRASAAVTEACARLGWPAQGAGHLGLHRLSALTQTDYDHLLWACDLNFVRGEDSLVRAVWARKPFVWHIYPQDDGAHLAKLNAFLDWAQAPASVRRVHTQWNATHAPDTPLQTLIHGSLETETWALQLADKLWPQPDLVSQLLDALPATPALTPV